MNKMNQIHTSINTERDILYYDSEWIAELRFRREFLLDPKTIRENDEDIERPEEQLQRKVRHLKLAERSAIHAEENAQRDFETEVTAEKVCHGIHSHREALIHEVGGYARCNHGLRQRDKTRSRKAKAMSKIRHAHNAYERSVIAEEETFSSLLDLLDGLC